MNCKPNELAVVVGGSGLNAGRIFKTLQLTAPNELVPTKCGRFMFALDPKDGPCWHIEGYISTKTHDGILCELPVCYDAVLRPLRGGEGTDETLMWAPVPGELAYAG